MMFTDEQRQIIYNTNIYKQCITIQALAGTGKSTVLENFIHENPNLNTLYLTFNTGLSEEMTVRLNESSNVDCMTIHGFAAQQYMNVIGHEFTCVKTKPEKLIEILNIKNTGENQSYVRTLVNDYCNGSDYKIENKHMRRIFSYYKNNNEIPHDIYLKLLQVKKLDFGYDVVIVDEAQDITACILDIVLKQTNSTRIICGDLNQQIYRFRSVVNPFCKIPEHMIDQRYHLTTTFRFGPIAADFISQFLSYFKKDDRRIKCLESNETQLIKFNNDNLNNLPHNSIIISRTNKTLFKYAFQCVMEYDKLIHILGKEFDIKKELVLSKFIYNLKNKLPQPNYKPDELKYLKRVMTFGDYNEMKTYFIDADKKKYLYRLDCIEEFGQELHNFWGKMQTHSVDQTVANVIIATTHQTKGMEFDHVYLTNDFVDFKLNSSGQIRVQNCDDEKYNILYVGMTRVKKSLYINEQLSVFYDQIDFEN